ncbi:LAGLIDADG family homing endonuclease [Patescibacteria group bacterium]|nr:LAGLIDADG family homing endonuclease [Patescibacteria group bacterium]MBU1123601.1 LAGLIDADG family homing endonuclease [Patescibacteria group bacterium]
MHLTPDYIAGLVDGEGSFTFRINTNPSRRNRVEPRFYLKLKAEDKDLLDALKDFFNCGKVYIQRDRRPRHSLCYRFEVWNKTDLIEIIIPFFKKNSLRSPSRIRDFNIFCKAMRIIARSDHRTEKGLNELISLKKMMH